MTPRELALTVFELVIEDLADIVHEPTCAHLDDYLGAYVNVAYGDGIVRPNVWAN
jgi:hypothetical protein